MHSNKSHEKTFSKTILKDDLPQLSKILKNANIRPVRPNSVCNTNISLSANSKYMISKTTIASQLRYMDYLMEYTGSHMVAQTEIKQTNLP